MKRVQLFNGRYTKGVPFVKNSIFKGKGLDLGAKPLRTKLYWVASHPPLSPFSLGLSTIVSDLSKPGVWTSLSRTVESNFDSLIFKISTFEEDTFEIFASYPFPSRLSYSRLSRASFACCSRVTSRDSPNWRACLRAMFCPVSLSMIVTHE